MGSVDTETEIKCPKCKKMINRDRAAKNKYVCYECGYYFRVKTHNRIRMVADRKSFQPWFEEIEESNPLKYEGYEEKLSEAREKSGVKEAVTVGECEIYGEKAVIGICESKFMMGSMGHVVGEKVTQAIEKATELRLPVFLFCCSGGARMQEGIVSLMQMAKTSAAIKRHGEAGLLYATILTDPTTGGVTASFAMLGDVIMAEPGALIGFAGPRVIKQTLGQRLPDGFQTAEFLQEHGFVDGIVRRENLKKTLYFLITTHRCSEGNYADFKKNFDFHFEPTEIVKERSILTLPRTAWEKVKTVRRVDRPAATDYIPYIFDYVVEAHGDRYYGDDKALVGAVAFLDGQPVTVLADVKGKDFAECARRNYGMPMPEGYRKALRLMKQAEKFNRPIISFVNTPGAFCGVEAEERGQGEAIARNIYEMSALKVPVLSVIIGEGGSGGALGFQCLFALQTCVEPVEEHFKLIVVERFRFDLAHPLLLEHGDEPRERGEALQIGLVGIRLFREMDDAERAQRVEQLRFLRLRGDDVNDLHFLDHRAASCSFFLAILPRTTAEVCWSPR